MRTFRRRRAHEDSGEFLWLMSLSDLMILLFIFFVVLYSFSWKKLKEADFQQILATLSNRKFKDPVDQVRDNVSKWVKESELSEFVEVRKEDGAVIIDMADKVFFGSGEFHIIKKGIHVLENLGPALASIPKGYHLGIEGHTDDVPIHTRLIASNWELSSKRALAVFQALGLAQAVRDRTVIMSYADTKPIAPNRDEQGRAIPTNQAKNRRVTLRIF